VGAKGLFGNGHLRALLRLRATRMTGNRIEHGWWVAGTRLNQVVSNTRSPVFAGYPCGTSVPKRVDCWSRVATSSTPRRYHQLPIG
jgi:hypothetical protein